MGGAAKLGLLACLYFSQGLPFGFFTQALPLLLRQQGVSLGAIGLTSLLALPWALKFTWAPLVDRLFSARFGRRKSWIVPLQLGAVVVLGALSLSPAPTALVPLMGAVVLLNLLAATQDIATDGLAVDVLRTRERGFANGIQVAGYRVGMVIGGGVLLLLYERLGSRTTFLAMAGLTALATLPVLAAREPTSSRIVAQSSSGVHFLRRPGAGRIVLLIFGYKFGDAFATGMLRPFLADLGLSLADVGLLLGTVGFIAGLAGALAGGALLGRVGRRSALLVFGLLQAASIAGYAYLAVGPRPPVALYAVCAAEHFAGGMATVALFTCMMDWCSRETSATDYTVQASAVVIATGLAAAVSGFSAERLGYLGHFGAAVALSLLSLVAVVRLFPDSRARLARHMDEEVAPCV
jgi:MFS transporter, PAT family, beta-lactamase induction signal transducer AmpG